LHDGEARHADIILFLGPCADGILVIIAEHGVEHGGFLPFHDE
jgi:hypothetical protein